MEIFLEFFISTKEWILSAIGVAVLSAITGYGIRAAKRVNETQRELNLKFSRGSLRMQIRGQVEQGVVVVGSKTDKELIAEFDRLSEKLELYRIEKEKKLAKKKKKKSI